jgi:hypothetical protein
MLHRCGMNFLWKYKHRARREKRYAFTFRNNAGQNAKKKKEACRQNIQKDCLLYLVFGCRSLFFVVSISCCCRCFAVVCLALHRARLFGLGRQRLAGDPPSAHSQSVLEQTNMWLLVAHVR